MTVAHSPDSASHGAWIRKCAADHTVFFRVRGPEVFFIPTHVDDLTLICNSVAALVSFKAEFGAQLEISDLGEVHWLVGIQITRDCAARTISRSQTAYIDSIVACFDMEKEYSTCLSIRT